MLIRIDLVRTSPCGKGANFFLLNLMILSLDWCM